MKKLCRLRISLESERSNWTASHKLQTSQIRELRILIKKRSCIEQDLVHASRELEKAHRLTQRIFEMVLKSVIEECDDSLGKLRTIAADKEWQANDEVQPRSEGDATWLNSEESRRAPVYNGHVWNVSYHQTKVSQHPDCSSDCSIHSKNLRTYITAVFVVEHHASEHFTGSK